MAESRQSAEAMVPDTVLRKIKKAFKVFDNSSTSTVDVREIGTIICSLGCFPTQAEIEKFIAEVEEDNSGYVHWDKFLPAMSKVLLENKFPPIPESSLLQAFEVLDKGKKGYLEPKELQEYMTKEGESFTQEEMDEMLIASTDKEANRIYYKNFIHHLTIEPHK